MTPKVRLRDDERKALLSCILKLRFPGMHWMIRSTQMMLEPMTQAVCASAYVRCVERVSCCPTGATDAGHDPPAGIVIERHAAGSQADVPRSV